MKITTIGISVSIRKTHIGWGLFCSTLCRFWNCQGLESLPCKQLCDTNYCHPRDKNVFIYLNIISQKFDNILCSPRFFCPMGTFSTVTNIKTRLFLLQRCWKPQVKWQSEAGRSAPLGQTCCAGGSRNKGGEDGGVCGHGRGDIWGREGGEAVPVSWLFGPRSVTHTHTHTHEFHRFGGRNRQTGKKGRKLSTQAILSRIQPIKDTQIQQPRKVREERSIDALWRSTLQDVMAS